MHVSNAVPSPSGINMSAMILSRLLLLLSYIFTSGCITSDGQNGKNYMYRPQFCSAGWGICDTLVLRNNEFSVVLFSLLILRYFCNDFSIFYLMML